MEHSTNHRVRDAARAGQWNYKCPQSPGWAVGFKARAFFVERIGDDNVVADGLHVERHVAARQLFIHKRIFGGPLLVIAGIPIGVLYGQFTG